MLYTALILGLMGSLHCLGMCGPIAFMLPVDRSKGSKQFSQVGLYHFGRLSAYGLLGLVFGALGKSLQLFGMQQKLSVGIGILMILLVLLPLGKSKYFLLKPFNAILARLKTHLGSAFKRKTPDALLTIGFLNGFLPCGLVYVALFGAIAMESLAYGALYMVIFGIGTVPLMSFAVYAGNFVKARVRQRIQKLIPVFIVVIGALFILRGLGLGIPYVSPKPIGQSVSATMECHHP